MRGELQPFKVSRVCVPWTVHDDRLNISHGEITRMLFRENGSSKNVISVSRASRPHDSDECSLFDKKKGEDHITALCSFVYRTGLIVGCRKIEKDRNTHVLNVETISGH
jgi:hypothetical protein